MRQPFGSILTVLSFIAAALPTLADNESTPHSIIDRALKAGGGADKISQFKAVSFKATMTSPTSEEKATVNCLFAGHSLFRIEITSEKHGSYSVVGGGDTFWVKVGKEPYKEQARGSEKGEIEIDRMLGLFYAISLPDQLLALKSKDYTLTMVADQAVNGVQAVAVRVKHPMNPEAMLYFHKETGLPVKSQASIPGPKNAFFKDRESEILEVFFDDYKEFGGVRHFTKVKTRVGGEIIMFELDDLKLLKKLDPGTFKKPG